MDLFLGLFEMSHEWHQNERIASAHDFAEELRHELHSSTLSLDELRKENVQLKIRLGLLIRLLIAKGVFTAQEYSAVISDCQSLLDGKDH